MSYLDAFDDMFDCFKHADQIELSAVWIFPAPMIDGKAKARFAPQDRIRVECSRVVDGVSNGQVIGCFGLTTNTMTVLMDDNEMVAVNFK